MRQFSFVSSAVVSSRKAFLVTSDGTFFLISKTSGTPMKNITTASDKVIEIRFTQYAASVPRRYHISGSTSALRSTGGNPESQAFFIFDVSMPAISVASEPKITSYTGKVENAFAAAQPIVIPRMLSGII